MDTLGVISILASDDIKLPSITYNWNLSIIGFLLNFSDCENKHCCVVIKSHIDTICYNVQNQSEYSFSVNAYTC
jgi:hypothetical protein